MKKIAGRVIKNVIWGAIKELGDELILKRSRINSLSSNVTNYKYSISFDIRYPNSVSEHKLLFRPVSLSLSDLGLRDSYQIHDNRVLQIKLEGSTIVNQIASLHTRQIFRKRDTHNVKAERVSLKLFSDSEFTIIDVPDRLTHNRNDYELLNIRIKKEF
ncbi:MAG: hypothetical protein ACRCX2_14690 [Paraclostridium sp.]